ncbi:hypothetical protein EBT25_18050 [bacterium]|nr:hypothetical protein [bacterium]
MTRRRCILRGPEAIGPPLGSPEAALQMLDQLTALIAQFKAEADEIAQELRGFLPHSDPGRYLELTRRYGELQRWISTCEAHAA